MTDRDPTLVELARTCNIAEFYWDARGERHYPPEATLRHLLHAMHVLEDRDADTGAIADALGRERAAPWHETLPPVRVLYSGETSGVELTLPGESLQAVLAWSVTCEDGSSLDGEAVPAELPMAGDEGGGQGASRGSRGEQPVERRWLALPALPAGYHQLRVRHESLSHTSPCQARLIVAPRRCHDVESLRAWGPALQLYAIDSARNHGIGDFRDLAEVCALAGSLGADLVGINPLHALFAHDPESASPYSPSSRSFLNTLYIALEDVPGFDATDTAAYHPADGDAFIDYSQVAGAKLQVLETLHARFVADPSSALRASFDAWRVAAGEPLERFALFEALRERNAASDSEPTSAWWDWTGGCDQPDSTGSLAAARTLAARIDLHAWLQWLAATQLDAAAAAGRKAGLKVGLYSDLAVGTAAGGSDAWAAQSAYLRGVGVGAPPDDFSAQGQGWGLPPLDPLALRREGYETFAAMLRANMRSSGAIRIDHVMGLARLFWIPDGSSPVDGAYIAYPLDDMLAVLALESHRAGCLVIGEDLGTVPDGFRERLAEASVLSYKLMYFEKHYDDDQRFRQPSDYAATSLVGANTHDLPTLRGWWAEDDLALRDALGLMPSPEFLAQQRDERRADRHRLLMALQRAGKLPDGLDPDNAGAIRMDDALVAAIHAYLASAPSRMMVANLEDMVGQTEQMNLPGTDRDRYPNWRRRLPVSLEALGTHAGVQGVAAAIASER